ncbi:hypothetical protein [Streptomyces sp. NBC_00038]|uniref:hypothetical protein n=1 Tax=Streptomyces sp. NBC_00038 TaxID=2903615 RepID=UPI002252D657|nr:hypothetical protein [Streptomyces sp. NBC_00038]MCX5555064.1 hypothetical protein [Streptomyces sp. NBC_00038]
MVRPARALRAHQARRVGVPHSLTDDGLAGEIYEAVVSAVALLLGLLWRTGPGEEGEARMARLLDLLIDGLGTPAVDPKAAES